MKFPFKWLFVGSFFIVKSFDMYAVPANFEEQEVQEFGNDIVHTYKHSSGLLVRWIENNDPQTSFTLGVKTPTTDNTGVNHIIEHTVFTGSKNFPSSTLFFDANANYPHTYMNASTAGDMTLYPFATPYKDCYFGLLEVYLDSIFNPSMLEQPYSFYEEAFYYDPETNKYGGVVFNEMKGASSQIGRAIFRSIRDVIYEDTHYANDSGGAVEAIPTLSYEHFIDTYHNYYYPSNMQAVVYGDLEIDKVLNIFDEYVTPHTNDKNDVDVNVDPTLKYERIEKNYYTGGEGAYVIKSFVLPEIIDSSQLTELDLWLNTYVVNPLSPFRQYLNEKEIESVEIFKDSDLKRPVYSLIISQVNPYDVTYVEDCLNNAVNSLWETEELLQLEYDTLEQTRLSISQQDMSASRGIDISQMIITDWVHHRDEMSYYTTKDYLYHLEDIDEFYGQKFLQQADEVTLILTPAPNIQPNEFEPLEHCEIAQEDWSPVVNSMRAWQKQYSEKVLEPIELKKMIMNIDMPFTTYEIDKMKFTHFQSETDLLTTEIYLPTNHIAQKELPYLFLYAHCLQEVADDLTPFEGILKVKPTALEHKNDYMPYLKIELTSLADKNQINLLQKANDILMEKDDDWYTSQVDKVIGQFYGNFQNDIIGTLGVLTKGGQDGYKRYMYEAHYPFYIFCVSCKKQEIENFGDSVKEIASQIGGRNDVSVAVTCTDEIAEVSLNNWEEYLQQNLISDYDTHEYIFDKIDKDSVYYKKGQVDYLLYNYDSQKDYIKAIDYLASAYATKNYLHPEIRIKKGAYGSGMQALFPNTISVYTYRDPHYKSSEEIIENMSKALKETDIDEKMRLAKSEALCDFQSQFGILSSDMKKSSVLHALSIMDINSNYIKKTQKQIIKVKPNQLKKELKTLDDMIENSQKGICIRKD
ncbi:MAG: hypothetical protein ATN36_05905 [Epulopiscium sp. Nele67-Bin005]|nr:MAG: hypothetical protein ATN36_05905 [Epulopiscium sp. Nele67-Bin005]